MGLQQSLAMFRRQGDVLGEFACLNRMLMSRTGLVEEAEAFYAAQPQPPQPHHHAWLLLAHTWHHLHRSEWEQAGAYLHQLLPLIRDNPALHHFFATSFGPQFVFVDNGLPAVEAVAETLLHQYGEGVSLVHSGIYNRLSSVRFYQGRLDEALTYAQKAGHIVNIFGGLAWQRLAFAANTPDLHNDDHHIRVIDLTGDEAIPLTEGEQEYLNSVCGSRRMSFHPA